jgi:hypothetical protein
MRFDRRTAQPSASSVGGGVIAKTLGLLSGHRDHATADRRSRRSAAVEAHGVATLRNLHGSVARC